MKISSNRTEYSRYYSSFRGVDFSSDHTQVSESRLAYLVNMYKDYKSGQGEALETIAGFRRRAKFGDSKVYGIFYFKFEESSEEKEQILVHSGENLYLWDDPDKGYEKSSFTVLYSGMNKRKSSSFVFNNRLYIIDGKNYLVYNGKEVSIVKDNAYIPATYINTIPAGENANVGTEYEQRNILSDCFRQTFIADGTTKEFCLNEKELDSIESVTVYGTTLVPKDEGTDDGDYQVDLDAGKVTFLKAPSAPDKKEYELGYAGVEIVAKKAWKTLDGVATEVDSLASIIEGCTLCATFDGRVFFSGNPKYKNYVFYCNRNSTGYADPSYFGVLNYIQDGVGLSPITGLMCVSNTLMVLKSDTQQDSAIYFHTGVDTGEHLVPRLYPSEQGLSGLGCVGACRNFLDDPVFVSRLGVEGVSQLKISSERVNEHRSSLVDAKLVNTNISQAQLEEWGGYLWLLVDGQIFLADSRQRYADKTGAMQYEWYYLDGIGVYDEQYTRYRYSSNISDYFKDVQFQHNEHTYTLQLIDDQSLYGADVNEPDSEGNTTQDVETATIIKNIDKDDYEVHIAFVPGGVQTIDGKEEYKAYLCETDGDQIGGKFKKATAIKSITYKGIENIFFGCENGVVCSFNFDKRNKDGEIPTQWYSFDSRIILSGCATLMDNCNIPHLTKSTIKRSTVIKTKSFKNSTAKIKVRTNKKPYEQIARISSGQFSFDDVNFADFSFDTSEQSLFSIKEYEKQWVEKQYYIYSDEYLKPFSLFYISYRYRMAGRVKY